MSLVWLCADQNLILVLDRMNFIVISRIIPLTRDRCEIDGSIFVLSVRYFVRLFRIYSVSAARIIFLRPGSILRHQPLCIQLRLSASILLQQWRKLVSVLRSPAGPCVHAPRPIPVWSPADRFTRMGLHARAFFPVLGFPSTGASPVHPEAQQSQDHDGEAPLPACERILFVIGKKHVQVDNAQDDREAA